MPPKNKGKKKGAGNGGKPAAWRVRIRMYRKWLGDCFLLSFRNGEGLSHILIDCGTLTGTPGGKQKMQEVARRIHDDTNGRLRALVATHEHWDHVSGFHDALDIFKQFDIGDVWAAWTEDPDQDVAKEKRKKIAALRLALHSWAQSEDGLDQQKGAAMAALAGFLPPQALDNVLGAFSEQTDTAMEAVLSLGQRKLLGPGDVVTRDWLPGVRVHVLAPPKNFDSLHNREGSDGDMYSVASAFAAAVEKEDRFAPFEKHLRWDEAAWLHEPRWKELAASHSGDPERRIDKDWLNTAAELALQLDKDTNNTSLVLAFELAGTKEVLLFVGDAQIGNWLSWAKVEFPENGDGQVSAPDLLARTVFYKVGHHGSHNATLKPGGLEAMTSARLVAAIPVDEEFARLPKGKNHDGWDMPAGPLLEALMEKTKGRVLRADSDFPKGADKPASMSQAEWKEFCDSVAVDPHFVEHYIR